MEGTDPPTLPPQMFTTSAQLLDLTDSTCVRLQFPFGYPWRTGGRTKYGTGTERLIGDFLFREVDDHPEGR
jgi:hypothetical protein